MRSSPSQVALTAMVGLASLLAGCTTPSTTMRNPATGQVVTCGGNTGSSLAGGLVGYSIQRSADDRCVARHTEQGFTPTR